MIIKEKTAPLLKSGAMFQNSFRVNLFLAPLFFSAEAFLWSTHKSGNVLQNASSAPLFHSGYTVMDLGGGGAQANVHPLVGTYNKL